MYDKMLIFGIENLGSEQQCKNKNKKSVKILLENTVHQTNNGAPPPPPPPPPHEMP